MVVQPEHTDARNAEQAGPSPIWMLTLTRLNGSLDSATHELDHARRDNAALKALGDRLTADEQKAAHAASAATAASGADAPRPSRRSRPPISTPRRRTTSPRRAS